MNDRALRYARSAACIDDLAVVREIWAGPGVLGGAGLLIFTTYAALPELTDVGADETGDALMLRMVLRDGPERELVARMTGLCPDPAWRGGITNPAVRATVVTLGERHLGFLGMRQVYLDLLGAVTALSALRVRAVFGVPASEAELTAYWRYMTHALALFGADLPAPADAADECARFVARHSGAGPDTRRYLTELFRAFPGHAASCRSALLPGSRAVVDALCPAAEVVS
jgi:hypothetical protein